MFKTFEYKDIDENKIDGKNILIDVRSPNEYENATIPGAINIPIFNDEERKIIGTTYVQDSVEKAKTIEGIQFIVLYGNTGTGKTYILEALKNRGMDVLDLESCANHRGSLLGSVGLGEQNSQKQFESLLYESLKNRKSSIVYIEGESRRIGKVIIPEYIYNAMNNGIHIKIEILKQYFIMKIAKKWLMR